MEKIRKISFKLLKSTCTGAFSENQKKFWVPYTENVNEQLKELCIELKKKASEIGIIDVFADTFESISEHNSNPKLVPNNMLLKQVIVFRNNSYDIPLYLGSYDSIESFKETCFEDYKTKLNNVVNEQESYENRKIKATSGRTFGRSRRRVA